MSVLAQHRTAQLWFVCINVTETIQGEKSKHVLLRSVAGVFLLLATVCSDCVRGDSQI